MAPLWKKLDWAFNLYDLNKDDLVTGEEIHEVLAIIGEEELGDDFKKRVEEDKVEHFTREEFITYAIKTSPRRNMERTSSVLTRTKLNFD